MDGDLGPDTTGSAQPVLGARARARQATAAELLAIARRHLAEGGAPALSLRAVARDAAMVSSAIYRYFPSRDDLLTRLIVEAFDGLGAAVEAADAAAPRQDLLGRWRGAASAIRRWALDHPHEYALIYGSPVPGYAAPQDTIGPATRVPLVLVGILRDAGDGDDRDEVPISDAMRAELDELASSLGLGASFPAERMVDGLMAWTHLFGAVSFELFGHRTNVVRDHDAFFAVEVDRLAMRVLGRSAVAEGRLSAPRSGSRRR
jgi:AcrR family transcriptional regulator